MQRETGWGRWCLGRSGVKRNRLRFEDGKPAAETGSEESAQAGCVRGTKRGDVREQAGRLGYVRSVAG